LLLLACSFPLHAAQRTPTIKNLVEYSLTLSRHETQFKFNSTQHQTKLNRLGINWYETFGPHFQAGLEVGYLEMLQATNPQNSSKNTNGEYVGLLFRFMPVRKTSYAINFNINYRYNRTKGNDNIQLTTFTWHEALASSELQLHVTEKMKFSLAAEYQLVDGEKRDTGTTYQTSTFDVNKKHGLRYGLHFTLRPTEVIGFEWSSGYKDGAQLYFSRQF